VWWLVTPGNPLKDRRGLPPIEARIMAAREFSRHPRIEVTGLEAVIGTRYTIDTLKWLIEQASGVRFVWIMGADNLNTFHLWRRWREIADLVPIAIVDRGDAAPRALGPAFGALWHARLPEHAARALPGRHPPAWVFLHGLKSPLSSTALRALTFGTRGG
jgi:nicotinate-nucleotide adenylyltransferase